jgi:hypothetical protein
MGQFQIHASQQLAHHSISWSAQARIDAQYEASQKGPAAHVSIHSNG